MQYAIRATIALCILGIVSGKLLAETLPLLKDEDAVVFGAVVFPPTTTIDKDTGECVGEGIRITRHIFDKANIPVKIVCAPAARIYKLIKSGAVDFTMNVKSTKALQDNVTFIEHPVGQLNIGIYQHADMASAKSVAAIRGFDYHGVRVLLEERGHTFFDVPSATDAVTLFLRRRTSHLVSYVGPFNYFMENSNFDMPLSLSIEYIGKADTFYAVSLVSDRRELVSSTLEDYVSRLSTTYVLDSLDEAN